MNIWWKGGILIAVAFLTFVFFSNKLQEEYERGVKDTEAKWIGYSNSNRDTITGLKLESYRKGLALLEKERELSEKDHSKQETITKEIIIYKSTQEGNKKGLDDQFINTYNRSVTDE